MTNNDKSTKSRSMAIYLAALPGLGHLYLRRYRSIIPFLIGYIVMVGFLIISSLLSSDSSNIIGCYIFATFALFLILMISISCIDVEYQCNLMGLPYHSRVDNLCIKNYGFAYHIWTTIVPAIGMISTIFILISELISIFFIGILCAWTCIAIVGNILVSKFRNVKYSDMKPCPGRDK